MTATPCSSRPPERSWHGTPVRDGDAVPDRCYWRLCTRLGAKGRRLIVTPSGLRGSQRAAQVPPVCRGVVSARDGRRCA